MPTATGSEYTGFKRNIGGIGFFVDDIGGFKLEGRVDVIDENAWRRDGHRLRSGVRANGQRQSVQLERRQERLARPLAAGSTPRPASNGQAPLHRRPGRHVGNHLHRPPAVRFQRRRKLGEGSLRFAVGYARHKRIHSTKKVPPTRPTRRSTTSKPAPSSRSARRWSPPVVTYRYEDLSSVGSALRPRRHIDRNDGIDNYKYRTPGVFLQAYRAFLTASSRLNGSVRYDQHNIFGGITSPRLNVLWNHNHEMEQPLRRRSRLPRATSFFEQDHGILDTLRIVRHIDKGGDFRTTPPTRCPFAGDRLAVAR